MVSKIRILCRRCRRDVLLGSSTTKPQINWTLNGPLCLVCTHKVGKMEGWAEA
jgi:hypothetical protein